MNCILFNAIFIVLVVIAIPVRSIAQTLRSYMENEIIGQSIQGPISEVP